MIKHKLVLIPPGNKRIRQIRIRPFYLIVFFLLCLCSIIGYLIPFDALPLNVRESNQKKYLSTQNTKLSQRIQIMHDKIFILKTKIDTLEQIQREVRKLAGIPANNTTQHRLIASKFDTMSLENLEIYTHVMSAFYRVIYEKALSNQSLLSAIPVLSPLTTPAVITNRFGKMVDPFTNTIKWHKGLDFSASPGTGIIATADGVIESIINDEQWGKQIRIKHSFGFSTAYAHLSSVMVSRGQRVQKGQLIGSIGMSGQTTGPHLHYEVYLNGNEVDPEKYFFPKVSSIFTVNN